MACLVVGSPMIEQLQPRGGTGKERKVRNPPVSVRSGAGRNHPGCLPGRPIGDDRAVTTQGRHREGAEDHEVSCFCSFKGWPADSQVFLLTMIGALNSTARAMASEERLSKM